MSTEKVSSVNTEVSELVCPKPLNPIYIPLVECHLFELTVSATRTDLMPILKAKTSADIHPPSLIKCPILVIFSEAFLRELDLKISRSIKELKSNGSSLSQSLCTPSKSLENLKCDHALNTDL